jgi:aspartyl-tRNA(Asn)/glutamyl-tRNA(Gln) amidotransferase subunit C
MMPEPALRFRRRGPARTATSTRRDTGAAATASTPSIDAVSDRITPADVAHVARLARLELTAAELETYTAQLGTMLEHFADIDALDLHDVEPMNQPYPLVNVLRDDVVGECLDRDEVLAQAPQALDGRFWVPPIMGEAP